MFVCMCVLGGGGRRLDGGRVEKIDLLIVITVNFNVSKRASFNPSPHSSSSLPLPLVYLVTRLLPAFAGCQFIVDMISDF